MRGTARLRVGVLLILIVVALASSLWAAWYTGDWGGLVLNFGTEMAGAVVTYALLELFIGGRERREAKKADLIAQMGSRVYDVAIAAVEELRRRDWLTDGSLQRIALIMANLQGANLFRANLQRANLSGANLQEAFLSWADLQGASLEDTKLQEADLTMANLQGANLAGANLQNAKFDEYTTLPDGTNWTPDTDMARFTDPDHPDFWRPDA
jgi:uncharacterized protein YjbI with pentapeptide repeats